jgi:hypothetical protein
MHSARQYVSAFHTNTIESLWPIFRVIFLNLENTGQTPTRKGRSNINWRTFKEGLPDDFDFLDDPFITNEAFSVQAK